MPDSRFFKSRGAVSLAKLAEVADFEVADSYREITVSEVAPIESATANAIAFLSNAKYSKFLATTQAGVCIVEAQYAKQLGKNTVPVVAKDPYVAYAKVASYLYPQQVEDASIAPTASIAESAVIGEGVTVGPHVTICDGVTIGDNSIIEAGSYIGQNVLIGASCHIHANSTIIYAVIGDSVIIHSGVRIGQDGFGYANDKGVHIKVPQLGRVVIEDHVEIGANSCIDRGAGPDTVIGQGSKIDNLVQIGHNARLGKGCILVSQSGVSGSTTLGDYVVLGAKAGTAGHLTIGSFVQAAAKAGIIADVEAHTVVGGYPAVPIKQWHRQTVAVKKLTKKKGV